ncbi:MAG TPA: type II secretion system protein [Paucimonas sp.]|nr:type II secretion system protein [Paucimonas sp.]
MGRQRGFSYVIVMFTVAVATILSVRALENSLTAERRVKEAELLYVGQAYRDAIRSYYENTLGSNKQYPEDLDQLLEDADRTSTLQRHLRKRYRDPITGSADWGLVRTEDGKQIIGVYSLSTQQPIKSGGFSGDFAAFASAKTYQDWKFVYKPN